MYLEKFIILINRTGQLRMAIQRVGIHKDKRLSGISKKIKEIKQYLENGN